MIPLKEIRGSWPLCLATALALSLAACGARQAWREVDSFKNAKAGTLLRLQPLNSEALKIPLEQVTHEFHFGCAGAAAGGQIEYQTFVGVMADGFSMETTSSTLKQWSPSAGDVVFQYHVIPPHPVGKARMYFYLVDKDGRCISNIIEWKTVFVKPAN